MSDVFFSYASADRDRVRLALDGLSAQQIPVFWDQTLPPGENWDEWIRGHLGQAKVAVVFWSRESINSRNVRDEANLALLQQKLIPVLLDSIPDGGIPLGLGTTQCANLIQWKGHSDDANWEKLAREIENKITPLFAKLKIDQAERRAEHNNERAMRAAVLSEQRLSGVLESLKEAEQNYSTARLDVDLLKARMAALEGQLASERGSSEQSSADLLQRIALKDVEISSLVEKSDSAAVEKLQNQAKEIQTLTLANEALRQRLYQAAETRSAQETDKATHAALLQEMTAIDEQRRRAESAVNLAHRTIAEQRQLARHSEEFLRNQLFTLEQTISEIGTENRALKYRLVQPALRKGDVSARTWQMATVLAACVAVFMAALAGTHWLVADGDKTKMEKEKETLERDFRQCDTTGRRVEEEREAEKTKGAADIGAAKEKTVASDARSQVLNEQLQKCNAEVELMIAPSTGDRPRLTEPITPVLRRHVAVLGSLQNKEAAQRYLEALRKVHPGIVELQRTDVREADAGEKGIRYRLQIGPFGSQGAAEDICKKLRERGQLECWVAPGD